MKAIRLRKNCANNVAQLILSIYFYLQGSWTISNCFFDSKTIWSKEQWQIIENCCAKWWITSEIFSLPGLFHAAHLSHSICKNTSSKCTNKPRNTQYGWQQMNGEVKRDNENRPRLKKFTVKSFAAEQNYSWTLEALRRVASFLLVLATFSLFFFDFLV